MTTRGFSLAQWIHKHKIVLRLPWKGEFRACGRTVPQAKPPAGAAVAPARSEPAARRLLRRVTCPHCWHAFLPEQVLWISRHAELLGDQVLGAGMHGPVSSDTIYRRGQAIDARGMTCHWLACPSCHLPLIRDLLESEPLFLSIIGIPSSGKSCFLAAMTWELRRVLPAKFGIGFADADTVSNRVLSSYEETLFLQGETDEVVAIRKTELQGELYDQIQLGQQVVSLPRPFMFVVRPPSHQASPGKNQGNNRIMCLYDNAGEHFQPGMDSASSPVTQHLAKSRVLMFVYDPTQDMHFRERCRNFSQDPQLSSSRRPQRQETILRKAGLRVRRYASLASTQPLDRPLLVLVAKAMSGRRCSPVSTSPPSRSSTGPARRQPWIYGRGNHFGEDQGIAEISRPGIRGRRRRVLPACALRPGECAGSSAEVGRNECAGDSPPQCAAMLGDRPGVVHFCQVVRRADFGKAERALSDRERGNPSR